MRNRLVALTLFLLLAGAGAGVAWGVARAAGEPSAFAPATGRGDALVSDAQAAGLEAQRSVAGPLGLRSDTGVAPARTLLVVVAPPRPYREEEQRRVADFLAEGGRVLVADAFGQAGSLTAPLGVTFERVRLVETQAGARPLHVLDGRSFPLELRGATALQLGPGLAPAASTSPSSFIDRDGDGAIGAAEPHGPFPVAVEVPMGEEGGILVALSSPALLAPAPADAGANRAWRQALLAHLLPEGGLVLVDESRQGTADPALAALAAAAAAAGSGAGAIVLGALAALLLGAAAIPQARDAWGPHRFRPHRYIRRGTVGLERRGSSLRARPVAWTRRGAVALLAAPALGLAALVAGNAQAAWAAGLLALAVAAALIPGRPRAAASRSVTAAQGREDAAFSVHLALRARRRADLEFLDALPEEFRLSAGENWFRATVGRESVEATYQATPALRGPYAIGPLLARRADALRLRQNEAVCAPPLQFEVIPRREGIGKVPFKARVPSPTLGPHLVNRAGDGSEFHSLRGYQEGDSFRAINWRASARSKDLVVSQRVHESMTTVTLFLDTRAVSGAGPAASTPLAQGCRAALSLAAGALQVRNRVRLVGYGDGVQELRPAPASRQLHEATEFLAHVPARGGATLAEAVQQTLPRLKPGNPVVLLSGLEGDPTIPAALRTLRSHGLLPLVVASPIATAPTDPGDGPEESEAAAILAGRAACLKEVRGTGVPVFETIEGIPLDHLFRLGGGA